MYIGIILVHIWHYVEMVSPPTLLCFGFCRCILMHVWDYVEIVCLPGCYVWDFVDVYWCMFGTM